MSQASSTVKKIGLELGGNAPFIVFDDADLELAVEGAVISKYRNAGQTCVSANRIYVQDGVYIDFLGRFRDRVAGLEVGNGMEEGISQGPLINEKAVKKVERHIADAIARGGKVILGGNRHELGHTFFEPTIISDATTDMLVTHEETFGPVAPVYKFSKEEEVVCQANASPFGLAGYFYTRDLGRAFRIAEALEVGMVGVNSTSRDEVCFTRRNLLRFDPWVFGI